MALLRQPLARLTLLGPPGCEGALQLGLRATPVLAQLCAGALGSLQAPGSATASPGILQWWGQAPAAAAPRRHFAASAAWQQSRHTVGLTSPAAVAATAAGSGGSSSSSVASGRGGGSAAAAARPAPAPPLQGSGQSEEMLGAGTDVEWIIEDSDPSDCSMCNAGGLDEEARAAVEAQAAAAAARGAAATAAGEPPQRGEATLPGLLRLAGSLGGDSLVAAGGRALPAAAAAEQVFKADAHYVGSKIDIYALKARPEFSGHYKKVHKGAVVLALNPRHVSEQCETQGMPLDAGYMVAFNYGSVVFFNAGPKLRQRHLAVAREVAADPVSSERPYVEEYCLTLSPQLPVWSSCSPDNIKLQCMDLKNMQVISQVLAQSVAMDFYSSHVERTLETFCNMNLEMQETQNISKINKQVLLQLVAENNIVMTDIINKLGVHERFDIAWKHVNYGKIWEFLRSELEMDGRFKTLESKLNLIQDNLKYFLEILQNRKSDTLEWIIIILIGAEICLSLYDLYSKGFA